MKFVINYYASEAFINIFSCNISICFQVISTFRFKYLILIDFSQSINTEYKHLKMEGVLDSIFLLRIVHTVLENEMSWQL